ncbi:MAG: hypothetical protein E7555_08025 [Ruminococcaceae bacterium]|nr:hypothetical protein [Oscillospiraceae bacterium]
MKRFDFLQLTVGLFSFRTIEDNSGNEYVVYCSSTVTPESLKDISDRTEFEALENHVHLLDKITKKEFENAEEISDILGKSLLNCLRAKYPDKHFFVYVSVDLKDSMIIRFHQEWENEEPYYNAEDDFGKNTKLFIFHE